MEGSCAGRAPVSAFLAEFDLGEFVYLKTDVDQSRRIVASVAFHLAGGCLYRLILGDTESWHAGPEMSRERDALAAEAVRM